MRGIRIGDTVSTQDGKHTGKIEEIRTVRNKINRELNLEVVIKEKKGYRFVCDIDNIVIV